MMEQVLRSKLRIQELVGIEWVLTSKNLLYLAHIKPLWYTIITIIINEINL